LVTLGRSVAIGWLLSGQASSAKPRFNTKTPDAMTIDSATPIRCAAVLHAARLLT
jgi:hypothetical protein